MNTKFSQTLMALLFLFGASTAAFAQAKEVTPKPTVYTTGSKLVIAKLKQGDADAYDVRGKMTFTVTAANSDDTVAGTISYTLPDDARQKVAAISGKPLNSISQSLTRKDVIASFQKAAAPPIIHLVVSAMDVDVAGVKMHFNQITLDVNARDGNNVQQYTPEEMEALFTIWAKQILNGRARRGIIARMNKAINGEPE